MHDGRAMHPAIGNSDRGVISGTAYFKYTGIKRRAVLAV
jgi:hypothetical protein